MLVALISYVVVAVAETLDTDRERGRHRRDNRRPNSRRDTRKGRRRKH